MPNDDYYSELDLNGDRRPIIDADGMRKVNPTGSGSLSINRKDNTTVGTDSVAVGYDCEASGLYSFAEGQETVASGPESHAEGRNTTASGGDSHAEGLLTTASGIQSHAEGDYTIASGDHSHSEGMRTVASGICSHAEGYYTVASSGDSHAEGLGCQATNLAAHAEGDHTIAASAYQHTSGRFNIVDQSDNYIEIVGNGTADNDRSNARKLDWQGNETIAGDFYFNGGSDSLTTQLANKADISTIPTDADQISYDNQTSGLVATDVQAAIDETFATIPTDAVDIDYDNTASGLSATDAQEAIDEVASGVSDKMNKQDPTGTGIFTLNSRMNPSYAGDYSFVAGDNNDANGDYSVAMGHGCSVSGEGAQAFGLSSAFGDYSHAEGYTSAAGGDYSHAEGAGTRANGESSHAEGTATKASSANQHVSGKFNVEDNADTYAEIIGNGTADNARSNARTLDWNGNETIAGDLYFNGGASPLSAQLAAKADPPSNPTNVVPASAAAVPTGGTWTKLEKINLPVGKLCLVTVHAQYENNTTGYRSVGIGGEGGAATIPLGAHYQLTLPPPNGAAANLVLTVFFVPETGVDYYIVTRHTMGSTKNCTYRYRFVSLN